MAPQTGTAILVLVVFVLPGFVALRYAEQTYRTHAQDSTLERILTALYFSLLSYVIIATSAAVLLNADRADVQELWHGDKPLKDYLVLAAAGIAVPVGIAELARRWIHTRRLRPWVLRQLGISPVHKTPSGWEHFFLKDRWAYVRATLKDGRVIGGFFGADSFAGYTADTPDLYLEQRHQLDDKDWFDAPAAGTLGVYIRADEIVSVEFYEAGAAPSRPHWWRRAWARLRRDGTLTENATTHTSATANPEERRDHTVGPDTAGPTTSAAATGGLGDISPAPSGEE